MFQKRLPPPDMCAEKFPLASLEEQVESQARVRTPIRVSEKLDLSTKTLAVENKGTPIPQIICNIYAFTAAEHKRVAVYALHVIPPYICLYWRLLCSVIDQHS